MNPRGKKLEPKLGLHMPFTELLERLMRTNPKDVEESVEKAKQKEPPKPKRQKRIRS
jgi:hypothetical protein